MSGPQAVTIEERDRALALFATRPVVSWVAKEMGWGQGRAASFLEREGVMKRQPVWQVKGRTAEESKALYDLMRPLWRAGAPMTSIREETGLDFRTIQRMMVGTKRGTSRHPRALPSALPPADDEATWRWVAGVFDCGLSVLRNGNSIELRVYGDPAFIAVLREVMGVGVMAMAGGASNKSTRLMWKVTSLLPVQAILTRVLPYVRHTTTAIQRAKSELDKELRYDG